MITALIRDTNRLALIPRARSISTALRERGVPFGALYEFETLLARRLHPGRSSHPVADYHYGSYYRERAARYESRIKDLADRDRLGVATLIPILAELDHTEGPQFVLLFLKEAVRPRAAKTADHLLELEKDHHHLKAGLAHLERDDQVQARESVVRDFHEYVEAHDKNSGRTYIARAELDPVLEPHVPHLRQILETRDPDEDAALTSEESTLAADATEAAQDDAAAASASTAASAFEAALDAEAATEPEAAQSAQAVHEEEHPFAEVDAEPAAPEENPAIAADENNESAPPSDSTEPAETTAESTPEEATGPDAEERRLQEYLARKRGELEEIEQKLNQDLADIQAEDERGAHPEHAGDDPAERADRSVRGLGDELYRRYHPQLREILEDADGLFARIFALLSSLARRLTIPEMRTFVDHLIAELEKDPAVREREPHLIPRLVNYRNSLREETPRLLNMIHQKLAEIRRAGGEPVDVIAAQLDYLRERLQDETFQSIWPTIFTIYQNIVEQQFDARVFDEIAREPLHKQQRILAALKESLPEHSRARRAVEARLRGAELAAVGERLDREEAEDQHADQTDGAAPAVPNIDSVLKTLRRSHAYDPVERVRNEIAAFDAGEPAPPNLTDESVSARAEEVRRLFVENPAQALTFAESILNDVAAPPAERAAVLERLREEAESPPAGGDTPEPWREQAGLTYLFHQTVESAGDHAAKIKRITEFEAAGIDLPGESFAEKRRSVERERRSNAAAAALSTALQEKDRDKRKTLFQSFLDNPESPEGLRRELRAGHDDRFDEAFTSITAAPHTAANKARMLTALHSIAHSRRILNPERDRRLRAAIDRYRRMAQTHDSLDDTKRGARSFFLRNGAQLPRLIAGKKSPASVFPEIFARERKHTAEYRASLEALHILEAGAAEGWIDAQNLDEAPEFIRKSVAPAFRQVVQRRYGAARGRRPGTAPGKRRPQTSNVGKLLKSDHAPTLQELRKAYAHASPAERTVLQRIARLNQHTQTAEAARRSAGPPTTRPAGTIAQTTARGNTATSSPQRNSAPPQAAQPGGAAPPGGAPSPAGDLEDAHHRRIVTEAGETFQETVLDDIDTPAWDDGSVPVGLTDSENNLEDSVPDTSFDADTPLQLDSAAKTAGGSKKAAANKKAADSQKKTASASWDQRLAGAIGGMLSFGRSPEERAARKAAKEEARKEAQKEKKETVSIAKLATRAEKKLFKGSRDAQGIWSMALSPDDLLEEIRSMPELRKQPEQKREHAAEAIKSSLAVTVMVPKSNRIVGMPQAVCFPRKDWNNELKRRNLIKAMNEMAEKQLPGSEKYQYFKFLADEIQFHYYEGKYKRGQGL